MHVKPFGFMNCCCAIVCGENITLLNKQKKDLSHKIKIEGPDFVVDFEWGHFGY